MRLSQLVFALAVIALPARPALTQGSPVLRPDETAAVLGAVLDLRPVLFSDSVRVDFCSVAAALEGDTAWVPRLPARYAAPVREALASECRDLRDRAAQPRVVWYVRRFEVETGDRVYVRATRSAPGFIHHEAYDVRRAPEASGVWRVDSAELSTFIHNHPEPPPPPAG